MKQEMIGMVVASAGPHANHLHLASNFITLSFFTGQMLFLMPNQQRKSTKGKLQQGQSKATELYKT